MRIVFITHYRPRSMMLVCCHSFVCLLQFGLCMRFLMLPVPQPGYYAKDVVTFLACIPPESCPGVDGSSISPSMLSLQPYVDSEVGSDATDWRVLHGRCDECE